MKIEGIDITDEHIGRDVTYYGFGDINTGIITSYSDVGIFVQYAGCVSSRFTKTDDLYWENRLDEFKLKDNIINEFGLEDVLTINNFSIVIDYEPSSYNTAFLYKDGKSFHTLKYYGVSSIFYITDDEKIKIKRNLQIDTLV